MSSWATQLATLLIWMLVSEVAVGNETEPVRKTRLGEVSVVPVVVDADSGKISPILRSEQRGRIFEFWFPDRQRANDSQSRRRGNQPSEQDRTLQSPPTKRQPGRSF